MNSNQRRAIESLENTKERFHSLVALLQDHDTLIQSKFTKRTIGAVLAHILISTQKAYPMLVKNAKKSKPMPSFFGTLLGHYFSYKYSEHIAKKYSLEMMGDQYNTAHEVLIALVRDMKVDEWKLKTTLPKPNNKSLSIASIFEDQIPNHFEVHFKEITATIVKECN